jgi:hypothetical protein
MFGAGGVEIKDLLPRLPPDVAALFEPVSALMVLNASDAEFEEMAAAVAARDYASPLLDSFYHEQYHCFQTYCTGYGFRRMCAMVKLVNLWETRAVLPVLTRSLVDWSFDVGTCLLPARARDPLLLWRQRRSAAAALRELAKRVPETNARTVAHLYYPKVYEGLARLQEDVGRVGRDGVSALDLLEGSAIVYSCLANAPGIAAEVLLGRLRGFNETYLRALRLVEAICGTRAPQVFLPATALALRYEHPENALVSCVKAFDLSTPGAEIATARTIAAQKPAIEGAGRWLGAASDVASSMRNPPRNYDRQLLAFRERAWGIDEFDLLSEPTRIGNVPVGSLGFNIVTRDRYRGAPAQLGSLAIAAVMLGAGSPIPELWRHHVRRAGFPGAQAIASRLRGD